MGLLGFRLLPKKTDIPPIINNTFIGGVSAYINTAAGVAGRLSITSANVSNVIVDGPNISCYIDADYTINASTFINDYAITYYLDYGSRCVGINDRSFRSGTIGAGVLKYVYLPGCTTALNQYQFYRRNELLELVFPRLTSLGTSPSVFDNFVGGLPNLSATKAWFNVALQTNNGGGIDDDVAYIIGRGATVTWVTNYTPPETITGFTATQIYDDSAQFTWTAPVATNGVMRYQIFVNDVMKIETTKLTIRVAGLTNGVVHKVQIRAVDTFYNIGPFTTNYALINGTTITWENSFISYFNFDDNVLDTLSANTATAYNTFYEPGTSGNAIVLSGTSAYVDLNSTSIIGGKNAFSIVVAFKMNALVDNNVIYGSWAPPYCAIVRVHTGQLQFYTYTEKQVGGSIVAFTGTTEFHHLVATYDGDKMKMYLDGVLQSTTYNQTGATGTGGESEAWGRYGTAYGQYTLDSGGFLNKAVTQAEVNEMYAKFTQGEELIV